jgi:hypothetical protein
MRVGRGRTRIPAANIKFAAKDMRPVITANSRIRFGIVFLFREKRMIAVTAMIRKT